MKLTYKQLESNHKAVCRDCMTLLIQRDTLLAELRKLKAEKREMWKALSIECCQRDDVGDCFGKDYEKCSIENCPLLKGKVKP